MKLGKHYIYYVLVLKEYMVRVIGNHYPTEIIILIILSAYEPIKIGCGLDYTILHYDKIYICGNNRGGRLGLDHEERIRVPEEIIFSERIKSVHCGAEHRIALTYNPNKLYAWGKNDHCQLGFRHVGKIINSYELHFHKQIMDISCGYYHTIALTNISNILYVWGCNETGQLGIGHNRNNYMPRELILNESIVSVSCGGRHTIALTKIPNKIYVWGLNDAGQLGLGHYGRNYEFYGGYNSPQELLLNGSIISVNCGEFHTTALLDMGELYVWGSGLKYNECRPTKINLSEPIKSVDCGSAFTIVLTISGKLYGWGINDEGQLGLGNRIARRDRDPQEIVLSEPIESISCGISHVFASTKNGNIWVWGNNKNHQLCLGHNKHRDIPTKLKF